MQRDRLPARPTIGGERHRDVAGVRRPLRAQVARRLHAARYSPAGSGRRTCSPSLRVRELLAIARPPGRALRLQDRVLLRAVRGAGDVLRRLVRQPELGRAREEALLLRPHRGRLNRAACARPTRSTGSVRGSRRARREHGRTQSRVGACVVRERSRHRARRVGEVVQGRTADTRRLPEEAVLRQVACPGRLACGRRARSGRRRSPDCSPRSRSATTRARCARRRRRLRAGARRGRARRAPSPRPGRRRPRRRR